MLLLLSLKRYLWLVLKFICAPALHVSRPPSPQDCSVSPLSGIWPYSSHPKLLVAFCSGSCSTTAHNITKTVIVRTKGLHTHNARFASTSVLLLLISVFYACRPVIFMLALPTLFPLCCPFVRCFSCLTFFCCQPCFSCLPYFIWVKPGRGCFGNTIPRALWIFKNILKNYYVYIHEQESNMVYKSFFEKIAKLRWVF